MNFNQLNFWPGLMVIFLIFALIILIMEKRFYSFIKKYWFYQKSWTSYLASFLYILGFGGLILSLLDLRGPEQKIKMQAPKERTIILIDTSASMLAEDVKPSRLQKAILLAKHFARKAAGHQLSVAVFAEIQKKIVPFTNDLDLIDARLESIKSLRNQYGSSALSVAIQESVQYLREGEGEARGNLLVLTDGEETTSSLELKLPKDIYVALVGIGTPRGDRIPLDDSRGFRFGYKRSRGSEVITKLNEAYFKKVTSQIPNAKYWIASSYSLPSEDILNFFEGQKLNGLETQDMVMKPVLMEWIVVPSLILITLALLLKSVRPFTLSLLIFISPVFAQSEPKELSEKIIRELEALREGKLTQIEKIKLADDLYKSGAKDEALAIFNENIPSSINDDIPPEAYLNYGTALLEKGDASKGLDVYEKLSKSLDESKKSQEIKEMMDKNVVSYFQLQEQKKKEQKNKEQKKDQKQSEQNSGGQGDGKKSDSSKGNQDLKENKDQSDGSDKNKKPDDPNESEEEKNNNDDKESNSEDKKNSKPIPPQKVPAKLKQLMSDDRQLQMKMIENGTKDLNRTKSNKAKDW